MSKGKLWTRRLAYGSGDAACNIALGMMSSILILFYTDYIGIDPGTVGVVMLISRFVDGAATLVVGWLSEKTRSRWGKFRPWLLWSAVPYAVSLVLLFTVPMAEQTAQLIYIFVVYNLCTSILYNTINIPYGGLLYAMTRDPRERDILSTFRMALASVGRLLAVCGTLPLVSLWGKGQTSWAWASAIWAAVALALLVFCFIFCKEDIPAEQTAAEKIPLGTAVKALTCNRYFWMGAFFQMAHSIYTTATGTGLTYYSKYILGDEGIYSVLFLIEMGVLIGSMLLCPALFRRWGKRRSSMAGLALAVLGQLLILAGPTQFFWVAASLVVRTVGTAPFISAFFAFIGEAVEYGHWKTGIRQEGLVCSGCGVVTRVGTGFAAAGITGLLSLSGYISTANTAQAQSESVLAMIRGIYTWGPVLCLAACFAVLAVYKLEKQLPDILRDLAAREKAEG
ncbi:MAG: MFS transporter [Oscillospiraceae bacterium]|nr:MFS transporter [Oscillospiraceae bacterium]